MNYCQVVVEQQIRGSVQDAYISDEHEKLQGHANTWPISLWSCLVFAKMFYMGIAWALLVAYPLKRLD